MAIGRAIVRKPEVFLFDEPLSNLDTALRVKMRYEFAKLHDEFKTTMVYVTHDQVEAMTLADRIVVLQAGRIEQVGAPMELYEHPANLFVAGFIGSPAMNFLDAELLQAGATEALVKVAGSGETLRCAVNASAARPGAAVKLGVRPEHLQAGAADNTLHTRVTFVEQLGSMTYAYCSHPALDDVLTCAVPGDQAMAAGSALPLHVPPARAYLFDAQAWPSRACRNRQLPSASQAAPYAGTFTRRMAGWHARGGRAARHCRPRTAAARPTPQHRLLVWINGDKGYNGLQKVGDRLHRRASGVDGGRAASRKARPTSSRPQPPPARGRTSCAGRTTAWASGPSRGLIVPVRPGQAPARRDRRIAAWRRLHLPRPDLGLPDRDRGRRPDLQQGPGEPRRRPASMRSLILRSTSS